LAHSPLSERPEQVSYRMSFRDIFLRPINHCSSFNILYRLRTASAVEACLKR
jgi:hypothetical protein